MIKMVKIQHTCDICEKIADTNRITTPILIMDNNGLGITMQELDICQDCIMKVCPVQFDNGHFSIRENIQDAPIENTQDMPTENEVKDFDINNLKKDK
jgi:hypothetical protein